MIDVQAAYRGSNGDETKALYSDIAEAGPEFFEKALLRMPRKDWNT